MRYSWVRGGYHITATLINPVKAQVVPRSVTLQVVCGKKIGPIDDPHQIAQLGPGDGPRTLIAKCPKKETLIGGGYQRSNGITDGGVMTTESHRVSARSWQVVANDPGGFAGEAVSIGYCVRPRSLRPHRLFSGAPCTQLLTARACGPLSSTKPSLIELFDIMRPSLAARLPHLAQVRPVHRAPRRGDMLLSRADVAKAAGLLGYRPRFDLRSGLEQTIDWYIGHMLPAEQRGLAHV